jgi:predicted kinase
MLIILGGLPSTGKTTIARELASRLGAMHVRVDTIEQNIRAAGLEVGPAGHLVAYGIVQDNLSLGHIVIADSVNSIAVTRVAWLEVASLAGKRAVEIEIICSDKAEHRRRAETRLTDVAGLIKPTWQEIVERVYEPWDGRDIRVDTAMQSVEELVNDTICRLNQAAR